MPDIYWMRHAGDILDEACWRYTGQGILEICWTRHAGDTLDKAFWRYTGQGILEIHWTRHAGDTLDKVCWRYTGQGMLEIHTGRDILDKACWRYILEEIYWTRHAGDILDKAFWRYTGQGMLEIHWTRHAGDTLDKACWRYTGKGMLEEIYWTRHAGDTYWKRYTGRSMYVQVVLIICTHVHMQTQTYVDYSLLLNATSHPWQTHDVSLGLFMQTVQEDECSHKTTCNAIHALSRGQYHIQHNTTWMASYSRGYSLYNIVLFFIINEHFQQSTRAAREHSLCTSG